MTRAPVSYQLVIEVVRDLRLRVGRLGTCRVRAGRYRYTGSARRSLEARLRRQLEGARRSHWHIDDLLAQPGARVIGVRRSRRSECVLCRAGGGAIVVHGLGASDCRAGCGSHLRRVG